MNQCTKPIGTKKTNIAIAILEKLRIVLIFLNPITNFKFPEKCAILVGKEREGVPVEILNHVDDCIEIPQHGLIRLVIFILVSNLVRRTQ